MSKMTETIMHQKLHYTPIRPSQHINKSFPEARRSLTNQCLPLRNETLISHLCLNHISLHATQLLTLTSYTPYPSHKNLYACLYAATTRTTAESSNRTCGQPTHSEQKTSHALSLPAENPACQNPNLPKTTTFIQSRALPSQESLPEEDYRAAPTASNGV